MQSYGVSSIDMINFLLVGVSHQHILSYKPENYAFPMVAFFVIQYATSDIRVKMLILLYCI